MKRRATRNLITKAYEYTISIGYCDAQNLLNTLESSFYTAGKYGWSADVYSLGNTAIVTGYRPFGNIKPSYDMIKKYDDKAREVLSNSTSREKANEQIYNLLCEFIHECKKGSK